MKFLSQIINKSEFNKHVFTLFTGQIIVQIISFLASFAMAEFYSVEQIGIYSSFVVIITMLTVAATGRYDAAIVVEEDDEKVRSLWGLSLLISSGFSLLLAALLYFFSETLLNYFHLTGLEDWAMLIPLAVFVGSVVKATQFYFNKYAEYGKIKNSDIIKSLTNSSFLVGFGWFQFLSGGLIVANVLGSLLSVVFLIIKLPIHFWENLKIAFNKDKLRWVAKKYQNYLTLYSLSGMLNVLVSNGTPLFIIFFFTEKIAGYYFMAERIISIPLGFIVASISKVFYQKANELYREDKGDFLQFVKNIQNKMVIFLIPFLVVLSITAPYFFRLFGEGWEQAGEMVKYFAVLIFFNNLIAPVGAISNIINRLDILLYFNIWIAVFRVTTFYLGSLYLTFEYALLFSSIAISVCYIVFDYVLKNKIKVEINNEKLS